MKNAPRSGFTLLAPAALAATLALTFACGDDANLRADVDARAPSGEAAQAFHARHDHHRRMASAIYDTCFVADGGDVRCMGAGPLGDGTSNGSTTPLTIPGIHNIVDIAMGGGGTIALRNDGAVFHWGGLGGPLSPTQVTGLPAAVQVSSAHCGGSGEMCVVGVDGNVYSVGLSSTSLVAGVANATALSHDGDTICALIANGTVKCWGNNSHGEAGNGTHTPVLSPTAVPGVSDAIAIDGFLTMCALRNTGAMQCWGRNNYGQVGTGAAPGINVLWATALVGLGGEAVEISVGEFDSCAVLSTGIARCWGAGSGGGLGNGSTTGSALPVTVSSLNQVRAISAGGDAVCAIHAGGFFCWGGDYYGELGNGQSGGTLIFTTPQQLPSSFNGSRPSVAIGGAHACWIRADGVVKCWGDGSRGQLGNGGLFSSLSPTFTSISFASDISAGGNTTCAVKGDGTVWCWGCPLPATSTTCTTANAVQSPVQVAGISDAVTVRVGGEYACVLLASGGVSCWGADAAGVGVIGNNTYAGSATPVSTGITQAVALDATVDHACAVLDSGFANCWGANGSGQSGNNSTINSAHPVYVQTSALITAIATGHGFTQASTADGHALRWGSGNQGNGNGGTSGSLVPVTINGENNIVDVASGGATSCLLTAAGRVRCYGWDANGERGDGSANQASTSVPGDVKTVTPLFLLSLTNIVGITGGANNFCATGGTGNTYCWGAGSSGVSGNGTTSNQLTAGFVSGLTF